MQDDWKAPDALSTDKAKCLFKLFVLLNTYRPVQCADHVKLLRLPVLGVGGLARLDQGKP